MPHSDVGSLEWVHWNHEISKTPNSDTVQAVAVK